MANSPTLRTFEATTAATVDLVTEIELQIASGVRDVEIVRVQVARLAGTAATYQPAIGNASAFTTGTVAEKYLADSTAVADYIDETNLLGFCLTDANGKLYLRLAPDAGTDNQFTYSVSVRIHN